MFLSRFVFTTLLGLSLLGAALPARAQISPPTPAADKEHYVTIRLLPGQTQVEGGETITVGIEKKIAPKWHTYWINPGDSGTAARIRWSGVEDIAAAPILWPVPRQLPMGPLMNFGYEENAILLQDITLPATLPEGPVTITAEIDILVCEEICIPESHSASFILNGAEEATPAILEKARQALPVETTWDAVIDEDENALIVTIATDNAAQLSTQDNIQLYPEEWGLILNTEKTTARAEDNQLILTHARGDRALNDLESSPIVIAYEDGNGMLKGVRLQARVEAAPLAPTTAPATPATAAPEDNTAIAPELAGANIGVFQAVLLALLGGMILNLMPCVFPVLSIKALSLIQAKDHDRTKIRLHGLAYTGGILLSFAVIAGILIALKIAGAQIGWGFQLQNPLIILGLAYLFFLIGLNLAGYFDLNLSIANAGQSLTQRSDLGGSFFTGVLATLVATPCTAPFMGVAIGFALVQPAAVSMLVFLALGFGLALPYLALSFLPALHKFLPRPGAWMETFRQFLAFPMLASCVWLVWVLAQQSGAGGVFFALLGFVLVAFAIWLGKHVPPRPVARAAVIALLVLSVIAAGFSALGVKGAAQSYAETGSGTLAPAGAPERPFTSASLEEALQGDRPVFVNMTAAWCITCKVNERVALNIEATRTLFAEKEVVYFKGDWTNQNPEITKFLERYGRSGVPLYVYYGPRDGTSGQRPQEIILPQILTPGIVHDIF